MCWNTKSVKARHCRNTPKTEMAKNCRMVEKRMLSAQPVSQEMTTYSRMVPVKSRQASVLTRRTNFKKRFMDKASL